MNDCVIHPNKPEANGYVRLGRAHRSAHRMAWQSFYGPIPEGLELHHTCEVRNCVNPAHLVALTRAQHRRLHADLITHCPQGHEYTESNTGHNAQRRSRNCRTCQAAWARKRYHS